MEVTSPRPLQPAIPKPPIPWLHLGFALTGIGTVLLGCILPSLIVRWRLSDARAGFLFAAQFSGSAAGALLVRGNFLASAVRGYALLIASAVAIAGLSGAIEIPLFLCFGLGLGWAMTATSMLVSKTSEKPGGALSLLNVSWGAGAALCPPIASFWVRRYSPTSLLIALAIAAAAILFFLARSPAIFSEALGPPPAKSGRQTHARVISIFALIAFLYVGTEASVSGWMMSYVQRALVTDKFWAPAATSGFWVALILGRLLVPLVLLWTTETRVFMGSLLLALPSLVLLLLSSAPAAIVLCALLTGLALAPIFPLCVARVLSITNHAPGTKWTFAVSGLGGAVLPWITGVLSAHTHSLRLGLAVPAAALAAMIAIYYCALSAAEFAQGARALEA